MTSTVRGTAAKHRRATGEQAAVLPVHEHEEPWSPEELLEIGDQLDRDRDRLVAELEAAEAELDYLMRNSTETAGDDQADVGSASWERDHEMSIVNNARGLLDQTERAIERIEEGSYGQCEDCGNAIGKMRLQAFPRATLCMPCKQKQERR